MARLTPDEVNEQVKKQDDEFYGEGTISGSAPDPASDDDLDEVMEDATGEKQGDDELDIAEEVEQDEEDEAMKPVDDYMTPDEDDEEYSSSENKIQSEEPTVVDPYERLKDKDFER